jgi:beta-glucosidase
MEITFPPTFLWGTATAAHQVEGGNVYNDNWVMEQVTGSPSVAT